MGYLLFVIGDLSDVICPMLFVTPLALLITNTQ